MRQTLALLDDEVARRASRLPGWTVGHVVTHIARNADSQVRVLRGAMDGEHLEQYAGGPEQRARDIQDGSSRSGGELLDDLIASFAALEDAWDAMTADAWGGYGFQAGVQWPCRQLPFFRWREVEVHHVDLGLGYEVRDWPESYVAAEARLALAGLPERITDSDEMASLLGWLLGRQEMPSLQLGPWKPRPTDPALVPGA